ncbi:MAG: hypothetical protein PHX78_10180 [bacterium]|nr:hypothetical protein [bacterium]
MKVSCDEKAADSSIEKNQANEDLVIGDSVICIETYETIEEDPEFGPDTKTERRCEGVITKIQEGKIYIKVEGVDDIFYIKKLSSWIINESVAKAPPFSKGDIFECKPRKEEHKESHSVRKIDVTIKKL